MNPVDQSRRRRFRPIGGRGYLLLLVVLIAPAGCGDGMRLRPKDDPLVSMPTQPVPAQPVSAGTPPAQAATGKMPALPASYSGQDPASLAAGVTPAPEDPRHLAIPADTTTSPGLSSTGTARGASPGGVIIGAPEPVTNSTPRPPASPSPPRGGGLQQTGASSSSALSITSFEQAQQFLKQQGVTWQRLDQEDGGWKFACGIPNRSNPAFIRHVETKKSYLDPLSAMRAVIEEIAKTPPK
jgi:hypothetical protein